MHIPSFVKQSLALSVSALMLTAVHAGPADQQQIEELRQEIAQLKTLIFQQQQVQTVQQGQIEAVQAQAIEEKKNPVLGFKSNTGADVKVYGSLRADMNYIVEGGDNDFNVVASSTGEAKDKVRATAKTTRLGLDFNTTIDGAKVGGKLETDFAGSSEALRVRHAYVTYNNWLLGQTTSNFLSNHAPEMIDFGTNAGGGTTRLVQVRYNHKFDADTQLSVSAEKGDSSATGSNLKYSTPALTAKLSQSFAEGKGSTTVRALVEQYKDSTAKDDALAWGAAIGVNYQLADPLKLSADYSYVDGNNKYLYGSNTAYALNADGDIEQNQFHAVQVGATYKFSPKLRTTLGYGALFADDGNDYAKLNAAGNEKVQQTWLNLIYSPVKPIDLGLEYVNGERETFKGDDFKDHRFGLMARYSF